MLKNGFADNDFVEKMKNGGNKTALWRWRVLNPALWAILAGFGLLFPLEAWADEVTVNVVVTNNMEKTWQWMTQYAIELFTEGAGTVTAATNGHAQQEGQVFWVASGSNLVLTAAGDACSHFDRWLDHGTNNPLSYPVHNPEDITAIFAETLTSNSTPLRWLAQYNQTDENLDPDADGFATWEEYISDTNPTNADSRFQPLSLRMANGAPTVEQPATSTNRNYFIGSRTNLTYGAWSETADSQGNGNTLQFPLPDDTNSGVYFYRGGVRLEKP